MCATYDTINFSFLSSLLIFITATISCGKTLLSEKDIKFVRKSLTEKYAHDNLVRWEGKIN
jgi:hypothetical protein